MQHLITTQVTLVLIHLKGAEKIIYCAAGRRLRHCITKHDGCLKVAVFGLDSFTCMTKLEYF